MIDHIDLLRWNAFYSFTTGEAHIKYTSLLHSYTSCYYIRIGKIRDIVYVQEKMCHRKELDEKILIFGNL